MTMSDEVLDIPSLLSRNATFKGLSAEQLKKVAGRFQLVHLNADEQLFAQGEASDSFYIIVNGKLLISRGTDERARSLAILTTGDYVGEESLLYNRPRSANATAMVPSDLLKMERDAFNRTLKEYPTVKPYLQATITSRRLARSQNYTWLGPDETIYLMARRHPSALYVALVPPVMVSWLGFLLLALAVWLQLPQAQVLLAWGGFAILVVALLWGIWRYIDWGNDYYIVTNQRVIWIERVVALYDSRQEAPLSTVQTVSVQTDQLGRSFGYGDVVVRTFTGSIVMKTVPMPSQLAALIEEQLGRSKQQGRKSEAEAMEEAIRQRLGLPEVKPAQPKPEQVTAPVKPARPVKKPSRFELWVIDAFKVRFEENGIVTFRKHWILLLKSIWWSTLLIFLLVGLMIARGVGVYEILPTDIIVIAGVTFILILFARWLYDYVDWRNDIYQLTNEQIIDIHRKPLGKEDKKTAPIENILSLEHTRSGVIGLLFNYGDVIASVGATKFIFEGVFGPASVEQEIFQRINQRKRQQREAEANRERERVADWLAAYHRQMENLRREQNSNNYDQNSG